MLTPKKIQEYKRRLEKDLKDIRDWLKTHPEILSQEELREYDEPYQKIEALAKRKKENKDKKESEKDILSALEKIANGTFGDCIDSTPEAPHKIEEGRLEANPAYKRCCEHQIQHLKAKLEKVKLVKMQNNANRKNKKAKAARKS